MSLERIEDWNNILERLKPTSAKSTQRFTKLDQKAAWKAALDGNHWHDNVLKLVGSWLAAGETDDQIQAHAPTLTLDNYSPEETRRDIQKMIDGGRRKGFGSSKFEASHGANVLQLATASAEQNLNSSPYVNADRQFYFVNFSSPKLRKRLSNFTAEIVCETTKVDGRDTLKTLSIQGALRDGTRLPSVEIDAAAFDKLNWLLPSWGAKAQITVGPRDKDHIAAAIKYFSKPIDKTIYRHTGWLSEAGKHTYLSAAGGITAKGGDNQIETELQGILASYNLPMPSTNGPVDLGPVLTDFDRLLDGSIGLLLMGSAFRSVLSEFVACHVSIFLQGTTGTFKSAIAGCVQAFFGKKFNGTHLPENWGSTGNAIEKKAFLAKDTLFTIDDFLARGTAAEISTLHRTAERVLRGQGNQSGRDRLTTSTDIRGAYIPRGLILATGEDIPNGHSLQARCVIVSIDKGATDIPTLTRLQEAADHGQLSQIMSNFVRWVAGKADNNDIKKLLDQIQAECKKGIVNRGHARMKDNLVTLLSGFWLFLEFGKDCNNLSDMTIRELKTKALNAAKNLAQLQTTVNQEGSDADRFIGHLQSALQMGKAHLANKDGSKPAHPSALGWKSIGAGDHQRIEGQGPKVGWAFDGYIYLDLQAALSVIKPLSTQAGNYLGSSAQAISKALKEAGKLEKYSAERVATKVIVEGVRRNTLCLPLTLIIEEGEIILEAPTNNVTEYEAPF
jgi:hypothetical protein